MKSKAKNREMREREKKNRKRRESRNPPILTLISFYYHDIMATTIGRTACRLVKFRDANDRNRKQVSSNFWFSSALCFCKSASETPLRLPAPPPAPAAAAPAADSAVLSGDDPSSTSTARVEDEFELLSFWSSIFSAAKRVWSLVT